MNKIIWIVLILTTLTVTCDDRIEEPNEANIIVTMLRVNRIEIQDNLWITPAPIWGHLESGDGVPVDRLVVHWWSNMYWDEDDSSGHYKLLPNRRNKAIWYDNFGNRDTMDVNVDTLRWTTDKVSMVDSLGYFYNTLTPVKVMQKHEYLEDPTLKRFYKIKFNNGSIVDTCDMHRIQGERAMDITKNVESKEVYDGVEFSYDLLTKDMGYRINGIPVNSMIAEMASEFVKTIKNK